MITVKHEMTVTGCKKWDAKKKKKENAAPLPSKEVYTHSGPQGVGV